MLGHSSGIVTYKICIAILSDPCLKLWVAWSSSLPAWCHRTTSSGNLAEIEPAGNRSRSEFWELCFAHRWTGVCTAAQGDHSRDKDFLASWAPESLSNCTSAIPLIFVLHFKCSVLILDKKTNFTKLWRALWPLWHCSGVFTAHQACLPFCPNNWATIDHFVGTIAHTWSLHLPKLMIFKSHFNRSKEQRVCPKRLGAFLLWCNLHPKQGEVFPVPEVCNLSIYLLYHSSFHHFSFCKITAFHNIWSHRESVWGAPSPVQECFSRLIRCQTSFLQILVIFHFEQIISP